MSTSLPNNTPSDNDETINNIDSFIEGLSTDTPGVSGGEFSDDDNNSTDLVVPRTIEETEAFVLKNASELVNSSVRTVTQLQKLTIATGDTEMMASLAELINASTKAIDSVGKVLVLNKKAEQAKELKKIDIEGRKEIQSIKNDGVLPNQTNILIATREEIIAKLTQSVKEKIKVSKEEPDVVEVSEEVIPTTSSSSSLSA